jgi:hypothetical protein
MVSSRLKGKSVCRTAVFEEINLVVGWHVSLLLLVQVSVVGIPTARLLDTAHVKVMPGMLKSSTEV